MSNNKNNNTTTNTGIGFTGLLTILFIALKLTHVINWSWVWVLSPLWISTLLLIIACVFVFLVASIIKK